MKSILTSALALLALAACTAAGGGAGVIAGTSFDLARSGFITPGFGTSGLVGFGTPEAETVRAASRALGPPRGRSLNPECGAGPLTFVQFAALSLLFRDGEFVGWFTPGATQLTTSEGIGLGDSVADLRATYLTEVNFTTLGQEFAAEGYYGIIERERITAMWAGISCNFR